MAFKEFRNMKVYEQSGYRYKATPTIMLKGQWLKELGFEYGTEICVRCEGGKLTITKAEEADVITPEVQSVRSMAVAEGKSVYGRGNR